MLRCSVRLRRSGAGAICRPGRESGIAPRRARPTRGLCRNMTPISPPAAAGLAFAATGS